jgi:hypothetical protein
MLFHLRSVTSKGSKTNQSVDLIWRQKGATLSDKSARQEFGLTQEEIFGAMRAGKLQFQQNSTHGNPWFRLLRHEAEAFAKENSGKDGLQKRKLQKELADLGKEAGKIKTRLKAIERRRAELMEKLDGD